MYIVGFGIKENARIFSYGSNSTTEKNTQMWIGVLRYDSDKQVLNSLTILSFLNTSHGLSQPSSRPKQAKSDNPMIFWERQFLMLKTILTKLCQ